MSSSIRCAVVPWFIVPIAAAVGAVVGPALIVVNEGSALPGVLALAAIVGAFLGSLVGALGALGYSIPRSRPMGVALGGVGLLLGWTLLILFVIAQGFAPDRELLSLALVSTTLGVTFFVLLSRRTMVGRDRP